ncbi:putative quinol monooxygenase [Streptomyces sp. NPDC004539]|uniref:putative quinol monooxygenase n=1 Tax=Streptomyces sp. NPDC004539 TaxID=3154280 RepID=UPI0033BBC103
MSGSVVLVATLVAKAGQGEVVERVLREAIPAVHAEPGCLRYALHRKAGSADEFVLVEKWASKEALGAHMKGAAMRELSGALAGVLDKPLDAVFLEEIPTGDAPAASL